MKTEDKIYIATKYVEKGYSGEDLYYGDDLYNFKGDEKESIYEEILGYMDEYRDLGRNGFSQKYPHIHTY